MLRFGSPRNVMEQFGCLPILRLREVTINLFSINATSESEEEDELEQPKPLPVKPEISEDVGEELEGFKAAGISLKSYQFKDREYRGTCMEPFQLCNIIDDEKRHVFALIVSNRCCRAG